jgi:ubiquinone/menaquinone biosynthesis C-methylase UbiE
LDLGCGNGSHMLDLSRHGFTVTGFDISESGLELARDKFKRNRLRANFFVGSMRQPLPFSNEEFDAIICLRTLNHGEKDQVQKTVNEMRRVLKTNLRKRNEFSGFCARGFSSQNSTHGY